LTATLAALPSALVIAAATEVQAAAANAHDSTNNIIQQVIDSHSLNTVSAKVPRARAIRHKINVAGGHTILRATGAPRGRPPIHAAAGGAGRGDDKTTVKDTTPVATFGIATHATGTSFTHCLHELFTVAATASMAPSVGAGGSASTAESLIVPTVVSAVTPSTDTTASVVATSVASVPSTHGAGDTIVVGATDDIDRQVQVH
jgi:hypothetical protein